MSEVQSTTEYREIPGFPGYRVGNDGSVWCCLVHQKLEVGRGSKTTATGEWRKLKLSPIHSGHLHVCLCSKGKIHSKTVHRLVLEAFVGPCPDGMECRHFPDRNPENNRLENLSWATEKTNQRDRKIHGTDCAGEKHGNAKLTWEKVKKIRSEYVKGDKVLGMYGLARTYGVSQTAIKYVLNRTSWKEENEGQPGT